MRSLFTIMLGLSLVNLATAQESLRNRHFNLEPPNLAIQGYDPVSYFEGKGPEVGDKQWSFEHEGVIYLFSSDDNRIKFKEEPGRYEPKYGGWCAYAMGETGEKVEVDPETFKIIEGRLYLFYNFYFTNTLKKWNKNEERLKASADAHWRSIFR